MATRRERLGRGSRPRKEDLLQVRIGASEKQAFVDAADLAGIAVSAWVRERLRRAAIRELEDAGRPVAFLEQAAED